MICIELSKRQKQIIEIVKENEPISSEKIAEKLGMIRATLRPDLSILTMSGILDARPKVGYFYSGKADMNIFQQEAEKYLVEDVMKMPVVVSEESSIYDAIVTLFLEDTGTIYVVSDHYLAGVVSRKDFLKSMMGGGDMNKMPIGMIMTRMPNIATATKGETIIDAANRIVTNEVDSLPVVEVEEIDGKEKLKIIGKVSKSTIAELFVNLCKQ